MSEPWPEVRATQYAKSECSLKLLLFVLASSRHSCCSYSAVQKNFSSMYSAEDPKLLPAAGSEQTVVSELYVRFDSTFVFGLLVVFDTMAVRDGSRTANRTASRQRYR